MGYCIACGSALDEAGICTNEGCKRRKLQLLNNSAKDKSDDAKAAQTEAIEEERAKRREEYEAADKAKQRALNI